jgi:hypothetical protein
MMRRLWRALRHDPARVSEAWLDDHDRRAGRAGVDLPRWRTPAERRAMHAADRVVRMRERRRA